MVGGTYNPAAWDLHLVRPCSEKLPLSTTQCKTKPYTIDKLHPARPFKKPMKRCIFSESPKYAPKQYCCMQWRILQGTRLPRGGLYIRKNHARLYLGIYTATLRRTY